MVLAEILSFASFPSLAGHIFTHCLQGVENELQAYLTLPDISDHRVTACGDFLLRRSFIGFTPYAVCCFAAFFAIAVWFVPLVSGVEGADGEILPAVAALSGGLHGGLTDTGVCRAGHWCALRQTLGSIVPDTGVCRVRHWHEVLLLLTFHNSTHFNLRL